MTRPRDAQDPQVCKVDRDSGNAQGISIPEQPGEQPATLAVEQMLREVNVHDAVGMVLAHDLTQIIPGKFKGRLFRKGHVIRKEDIPKLLDIGKQHIYVMSLATGFVHEDEAAERMSLALAGVNTQRSEPHEGKVTIKSAIHGLVKLNKPAIDRINALGEVIVSTVKTNTVAEPERPLAATRAIPLIVEESKVAQVEAIAADIEASVVTVLPFRPLKAGLITTGSEVAQGRIQDKFGPVVKEKLAAFGSAVIEQRFATDDRDLIVRHIREFADQGVDLILLTGGMSVDPDDRTPGAIKHAGAHIVSYGTPMLPGSMLLMGYLPVDRPDGRAMIPIMGLPGCVMHDPYTSFDVLLPRICAGDLITFQDIVEMGYGGLYGC